MSDIPKGIDEWLAEGRKWGYGQYVLEVLKEEITSWKEQDNVVEEAKRIHLID